MKRIIKVSGIQMPVENCISKNALIVQGSPRKNGNTNLLCEWIARGMEAEGFTVEIADAAHLKNCRAAGCISCYACQKSEKYGCVIDDDLSQIIARMMEVDIIVLASPLYWFGLSSQAKAVLDRMFSLSKKYQPHENVRKAVIALAVTAEGSSDNSGYQPLADQFQRVWRYLTRRKDEKGEMFIAFQTPVDREKFIKKSETTDLIEKAEIFGKTLAGQALKRKN